MLVETGDYPGANESFLSNLKEFISTQNIGISQIFITHAHHDHIGGLSDVMSLLKPQVPIIYKMLTGN